MKNMIQDRNVSPSQRSRQAERAHSRRTLAVAKNRLSAFLLGMCLLPTAAQAADEQATLTLKYSALDAEVIYAVATVDGDLKVFNKGPGRARVCWVDPFSGAKTQRVLGDEEALFTNGQLGAEVSTGTLISIEKVGGAAMTQGFASLPTAPCLVQALEAQPHSSDVLPWSSEYRLNLSGTHGPSVVDAVVMQLVETLEMPVGGLVETLEMPVGGFSETLEMPVVGLVETLEMPVGGMFSRGLHNNGAFTQERDSGCLDIIEFFLGTPSIAGGAKKYEAPLVWDFDFYQTGRLGTDVYITLYSLVSSD